MAYSKIKRSDLKFGDELGEGGFSTVYQATWRQSLLTRKEVAAKKLYKIQRRELEIMSKLDHINIVKLLGVVDEKPDFYLILELCKGGSLREYLDKRQGKRLPIDQFCDWANQAAKPIEYLRKKGIVHKDIKSPNYVIADLNILKLTDFGIAKEIDVTMSNATGSASYPWMAPELLKDLKLSPNYDIFSLSVVFWELLTTDIPFKGLEQFAIIWKICNDNERPPIPADCPKPLADLMRQCWDVDWNKRPSIEHVLSVIADTAAAAAAAAKAARQKQIFDGPWEFEREIGKLRYPCGIAANPNGDIAVAGNFCVQVYSSEGHHRFNLDTKHGLQPGTRSRPWDVTVSSEGNYYVTDRTQYVKVYDVNGLYKGKQVAVSPQHKPSDTEDTQLRGLAMDPKDQLLVGEITQRYISKHRQDGSHITSINVGIKPRSLAVTSQDTIIISDWWESNSVHIVDNTGQLLNTCKPPTDDVPRWSPRGIACFEDIICICNHVSESIYCFSLSGEYLGSIPIEITEYPCCLTYTADSKRMLIAYDNVFNSSAGVSVYKIQAKVEGQL